MFLVEREENQLKQLNERKLSELNFKERAHLQEWIAKTPEILGEDLLIIQKEFAGFDGTKERLDLLALDKSGQIVVIENKLDDTGRDVTWQAIKYAAYCSELTKSNVLTIFQTYLDAHGKGQNAEETLCEFLEVANFSEAIINQGAKQRIIFVAANYRVEVTSAVLWLIANGIQAQCFKVTPYEFGPDVLLQVTQIIPPPEAQDFMVGMATKDSEEKSAQNALRRSHRLRLEFWDLLLKSVRDHIPRFQNISASRDSWITSSTGHSDCSYNLVFLQTQMRVELNLFRENKEENKWIFDHLHKNRKEIDGAFGHGLIWKRMNEKKSSRIEFAKPVDGYDRANWPMMVKWLAEHTAKLEEALAEPLAGAVLSMKSNTA